MEVNFKHYKIKANDTKEVFIFQDTDEGEREIMAITVIDGEVIMNSHGISLLDIPYTDWTMVQDLFHIAVLIVEGGHRYNG